MNNAELIKQLRGCKDIEFCNECPRMPNGIIEPCGIKEAAADALESVEKRIAELEESNKMLKNTIDADKGVMLDRIRFLEAQLPKWISVEDRLPEKMKNVLAANNRGKQWDIDKAWYNGAYFDRCGKRPLFHVTHWMPLPDAPKGEQE